MIKVPRSKVDEDLYLVLHSLYRFERALTAKFELDYEDIYALQYLRRHPGAHLHELASEMELPMFKCSRLISQLTLKNLVSKSQDENDRRNILIVLRPAGEEVVASIEEYSYQTIEKNSKDMSAEEFARSMQLVEDLQHLLGVSDKIK